MFRRIVPLLGILLATSQGQGQTPPAAAQAAAVPPAPPGLALDAAGHTAMVRRVAFTADGKELITCSDDKTIRFWDVATGESVRVLRPPIAFGLDGRVSSVAVAPDGSLLAAGGRAATGQIGDIYLIALPDGVIRRTLRGHGGVINDLQFFPDGMQLLSGSSDGTGRIWNVATGECEQVLSGHTASILDVAVAPDGKRCATAGCDHTGIVWSASTGERLAQLTGHTRDIKAIDWSPTEDLIISGSHDGTMKLYQPDGVCLRTIDQLGPQVVTTARFTADGKRILYAKELSSANIPVVPCGILNTADGSVAVKFAGHNNSVVDGALSPEGTLVATTGGGDNETLLWKADTGELVQRFLGQGRVPWVVAWSADGRSVAWGNAMTGNPTLATGPLERTFDLTSLEFGPTINAQTDPTYRRAVHQDGLFEVQWIDRVTVEVRRGGTLIGTLKPDNDGWGNYERFRCQSLLPDRQVAMGTSSVGPLIWQPETGRVVRRLWGQAGIIWSIAPSPDGRYLVCAADDMTLAVYKLQPEVTQSYVGIGVAMENVEAGIRIKELTPGGAAAADGRLQPGDVVIALGPAADQLTNVVKTPVAEASLLIRGDAGTKVYLQVRRTGAAEPLLVDLTRKETIVRTFRDIPLVSLFFAGEDWIAWTPEGYYAASPGGERLMGWHVNNGIDQLATFHPAASFRKQFYRPDVVKRLLPTGSAAKALETAGDGTQLTSVAQNLPPHVEITSPQGSPFETTVPTLNVTVRAVQAGALPVTSVQLLVNGRPFGGQSGVVRVSPPAATAIHTFRVPLPAGAMQTIQARADNTASYGVSPVLPVVRQAPVDPDSLPAMYVLAIGVADYDDPGLTLNYADDDARRLAETLQLVGSGLFRAVEVRLLTDKDATNRGIKTGLGWLKTKMTAHDVAVVFFSGHGDRDEAGGFYLLPSDTDRSQPLLVSGVPDTLVKSALQAMPGRILMLLDACHAGSLGGDNRKAAVALTDDLVRDLSTDDYGVVVMASSMGREYSLENVAARSGNFTLALIEGLTGKADFNQDAGIYFSELDTYVSERVKELSQGRQHPVTAKPATIRSFPLGRTRN